jgi:hypothetical protein
MQHNSSMEASWLAGRYSNTILLIKFFNWNFKTLPHQFHYNSGRFETPIQAAHPGTREEINAVTTVTAISANLKTEEPSSFS